MRTGYVQDDQAPEQDDWNQWFRWTGHDVQWVLAYLLFGESASTGDAVVINGLTCTAGSGMQTDYTAGAALHYDATVYTSTLKGNETASPFGLQMVTAGGSLTHSANSSGSDRIDLICILSTLGTDTPENVQQDGGSTTSQDTRWGHESSVVIVEGTGGAGVPATPTGYTCVAEVTVPNGAGSSAAFTYADTRYYARQPWQVGSTSTGTVPMVSAYRDDSPDDMSLSWYKDDHWPTFQRTSEPTGDATFDLFPMVIPGSRTWSRSYPCSRMFESAQSGNISGTEASTSFAIAQLGATGTGTYTVSIPADARGMEITGASLWYATSAYDGTINTDDWSLDLYDISASGTVAVVAGTSLDIGTTYGSVTESLGTVTPVVVEDGDFFVLSVDVDITGGTTGSLAVYAVELQFKEGRT